MLNITNKYLYFVIKLLWLLAAVFILDSVAGSVLEKYYFLEPRGEASITTYALNKTTDDVLIFGSSRANHHYVSRLIGDSLHLSCFNFGRDAAGIFYADALLNVILKRHVPKIIILDLLEDEFSVRSGQEGLTNTANALLPYINLHPELIPIINLSANHDIEKSKVSKVYPFNSKILSIIQHNFTNVGMKNENGFQPVEGKMDLELMKKYYSIKPSQTIDSNFVNALKDFLKQVNENHITLFAIISPKYFKSPKQKEVELIEETLHQFHFSLWNYAADAYWIAHPEFFRDAEHLNSGGAYVFSKQIAQRIKNEMDNKK